MLEALFGAVLISGWSLMVAAFVFSVFLIMALEKDAWGWTTLTLVIGLMVAQFLTPYKPFTFAMIHPIESLMWVLGYIITGVFWSMGKWALYALKGKEAREEWLVKTRKNFESMTARNAEDTARGKKKTWDIPDTFEAYLANRNNRFTFNDREYPLNVREHKARITAWMVAWPWSAIWTVLNDPIRRLYNWLYDRLGNVFQRISDKIAGTT